MNHNVKSSEDIAVVERQLGHYIGKHITDNFLPEFEVDEPAAKNIIKMSGEDTVEYNRVYTNWIFRGECLDSCKEGNDYKAFYDDMVRKYFPKDLSCRVPLIEGIDDYDALKDGMITALWNSDKCIYSLDKKDIQVIRSDEYSTIIFKLDI